MIKTIVFDMDGVLFDTERISEMCWRETAKEMNLGDLSEGIMQGVGLNLNDTKAMMLGLYGKDFPFDSYFLAVRDLMHEKINKFGLPIKEGAKEILEYLSAKKYKIGLASSSNKKSIMRNLEESGLTHYFEVIVGGDMVTHSKPDPDIYLKACEGLGVAPQEAIAIEDSPNGIRSAYRAGMQPFMVPDLIQPDEEIKTMLCQEFASLHLVEEYLRQLK